MAIAAVPQSQRSEKEIIQQAQENPEAFRYIYEAHFKEVFRFVHHRVGEMELAKDITQSVFVKALQWLPRYEFRGAPILSWLYRIAINECLDFFRKNKRRREVVLDSGLAEGLFDEVMGHDQVEHWLAELPTILSKLKPDELTLIELRFFESRPFKEVAEIQGASETNVKIKTYRILARMKKLFHKKNL